MVQGKDPSSLLDGVGAQLVSRSFLFCNPSRELGAILSDVASYFILDLSGAPSFGLSSFFALPVSLPLPLPFSVSSPFPFPWPLVSALMSILIPVLHAPLTVSLVYGLSHNSEGIVPLQPRRVLAPFWMLWVVCHHCRLDCVLERVLTVCFALPHKSLPLLQGLSPIPCKRELQELHQTRPDSVLGALVVTLPERDSRSRLHSSDRSAARSSGVVDLVYPSSA